jgi:hypothetical protein
LDGAEVTENFAVLDEFAQWIETHRASLTERGLLLASGNSPEDGRTKRSMWLDVEGPQRLGRLALWDTGEAELELAEVSTGDVKAQHHQLDTRADLERAAMSLVDWVAAAE